MWPVLLRPAADSLNLVKNFNFEDMKYVNRFFLKRKLGVDFLVGNKKRTVI